MSALPCTAFPHSARTQRGFTLVELMVTVGIALFLLYGLVTIVETVRRTSLDQQVAARLLMDAGQDLDQGRLAGAVVAEQAEDFPGADRLQKRLRERTVIDHFYDFLEKRGAKIPPELKKRDLTQANGPNDQVQKEILKLYKSSPEVSILFELMTDFDEGLQEWRYRHIKLVERTIGAKKGTGGSPGVPFLKESLFKPVFHDLWAIRHEM